MRSSILLILFSILFSACSVSKPELNFEKPEIQIPKKSPEPLKNKGSLYSMQTRHGFCQRSPRHRRHPVVTPQKRFTVLRKLSQRHGSSIPEET